MEDLDELRKVPLLSDYKLEGWVSRENVMKQLDKYIEFMKNTVKKWVAIASCCRGGGKSKLLNHVAESKFAEEFFPVAMTFSSFSPALSEEELDVHWALSKRVLFS